MRQRFNKSKASARLAPRTRVARSCIVLLGIVLAVSALTGCGGSGGGAVSPPVVAPARTYALHDFQPATAALPGRPTKVAFTIDQPSGKPLTAYKRCCDPHAGVDLILVRSDDSHVQYDDSDIGSGGRVTQPIVFPRPGRYRVIIDAYLAHPAPDSPTNFQLFTWINVKGPYHPHAVPPPHAAVTVDGYRFQVEGRPRVAAIQATFLSVKVTDPHGQPARFETWHGALAHAIFIRQGTLDYFHTHVCSPGATYCTSVLGASRVTGSSPKPGALRVGVLLPVPGTWRLFLLTYIGGRHITAPFTLKVT